MFLLFIADNQRRYFATLKPQLKGNTYSVMKKRITWNSAQTWVTKIVKTTALFTSSHLLTAQNLGVNFML